VSTVGAGPWEEHTATLRKIKLKGLRITPSLAFKLVAMYWFFEEENSAI
jgi:hypothetical protein